MKKALKNIDKTLLVITIILTIFGLIMIFSASSVAAVLQYKVSEYYFFSRQLFFVLVGFFLGLIIICIPTKIYKTPSYVAIVIMIFLLFIILLYGKVVNSSKAWLEIAGFTFQPSEFAKSIIIVYLACWYGSKKGFRTVFDTFLPLIACVIIFGLVVAQPDMGTALIIAIICLFIFYSLPLKNDKLLIIIKIVIILVIIGAGAFIVSHKELFLTESQALRLNFKNPCSRYQEDTGYQTCNGYIAINNGGLFGVGLGKSTQKYLYLPEAHTDMIFPIIVEELGIVGGGIVLILYLILLYRILVIARNANSLRGSIIAYGTFIYILTHIVFNIGGLLALIPITGVPLPFLSYGGSFIINLLIMIALTQRVAIEKKIGMK